MLFLSALCQDNGFNINGNQCSKFHFPLSLQRNIENPLAFPDYAWCNLTMPPPLSANSRSESAIATARFRINSDLAMAEVHTALFEIDPVYHIKTKFTADRPVIFRAEDLAVRIDIPRGHGVIPRPLYDVDGIGGNGVRYAEEPIDCIHIVHVLIEQAATAKLAVEQPVLPRPSWSTASTEEVCGYNSPKATRVHTIL
jgi:hypothetical protein